MGSQSCHSKQKQTYSNCHLPSGSTGECSKGCLCSGAQQMCRTLSRRCDSRSVAAGYNVGVATSPQKLNWRLSIWQLRQNRRCATLRRRGAGDILSAIGICRSVCGRFWHCCWRCATLCCGQSHGNICSAVDVCCSAGGRCWPGCWRLNRRQYAIHAINKWACMPIVQI